MRSPSATPSASAAQSMPTRKGRKRRADMIGPAIIVLSIPLGLACWIWLAALIAK